jgi:hypothetical protein
MPSLRRSNRIRHEKAIYRGLKANEDSIFWDYMRKTKGSLVGGQISEKLIFPFLLPGLCLAGLYLQQHRKIGLIAQC